MVWSLLMCTEITDGMIKQHTHAGDSINKPFSTAANLAKISRANTGVYNSRFCSLQVKIATVQLSRLDEKGSATINGT